MSEFIKFAKHSIAGEFVHKDYKIRKGHEIYNVEISLLGSPESWFKRIISRNLLIGSN